MICADFLAGANRDNEDPTALLQSMSWLFEFLPGNQRQAFLHGVTQCQVCGSRQNLQVHHKQLRGQQDPDNDSNLITPCVRCHEIQHRLR